MNLYKTGNTDWWVSSFTITFYLFSLKTKRHWRYTYRLDIKLFGGLLEFFDKHWLAPDKSLLFHDFVGTNNFFMFHLKFLCTYVFLRCKGVCIHWCVYVRVYRIVTYIRLPTVVFTESASNSFGLQSSNLRGGLTSCSVKIYGPLLNVYFALWSVCSL